MHLQGDCHTVEALTRQESTCQVGAVARVFGMNDIEPQHLPGCLQNLACVLSCAALVKGDADFICWPSQAGLLRNSFMFANPWNQMLHSQLIKAKDYASVCVMGWGRCRVPEECPKDIADLIRQCWQLDPATRPTAREIIRVILASRPARDNVHITEAR